MTRNASRRPRSSLLRRVRQVCVGALAATLTSLAPSQMAAQSATISGTVTDGAGDPFPGVTVTATVYEIGSSTGTDHRAATGPDGRYRLDVPVTGPAVFASVSYLAPEEASPDPAHEGYVALEAGESYTLDRRLDRGGAAQSGGAESAVVVGSLRDPDGFEPVANVSVLATPGWDPGTATEVVTGPDGAFRHVFTPPEPGSEVRFAFTKLEGPGQETKTRSRTVGPGDSLTMHILLDFDTAAEGASDEEAETSGGAETAPASEGEGDPDASYGDATLIAYVPFDGGTPDETARGLDTELIGDVQRIEGRYGDAALFDGDGPAFFPLDIDFRTHPRLTVSAWVLVDERRDDSDFRSGGSILSTGDSRSGAPELAFRNARVRAEAGTEDKTHHDAGSLPVGEWVHVAAVWDYGARTLRLHVGDVVGVWEDVDGMDTNALSGNERNQRLLEHPTDAERDPERYVLIGASSLEGHGSLGWVGLDDLRVYSGALSPEAIAALRESEGEPAELGQVAPPPPEPDDEPVASDGAEGALYGWGLGDDYELSDVTGVAGDRRERVEKTGENTIRRIEVSEVADRPCEFWFKNNRVGTYVYTPSVRGNNCSGRSVQLVVDLGEDVHLNTVWVCMNRANTRVKGLKVWGRRVEVDREADEVVFRESNADESTAANCHEWAGERAVGCPGTRQLASGFYVHFTSVRNRDSEQITGLQLVCRDVVGLRQ